MSPTMFSILEAKLGKTLRCSHCHADRPLSAFTNRLTKLFDGVGVKRVPKTCDVMTAINTKHNSFNNAVNNTKRSLVYYEGLLLTTSDTDAPSLRRKIAEVSFRLEAARQRLHEHQLSLVA